MKTKMKRTIHYFLMDYQIKPNVSSMEMYMVGVEGEVHEIKKYLHSVSKNAIYVKTSNVAENKSKGNRKIPCGIIRTCKHYLDMASKKGKLELKQSDERHKVVLV